MPWTADPLLVARVGSLLRAMGIPSPPPAIADLIIPTIALETVLLDPQRLEEDLTPTGAVVAEWPRVGAGLIRRVWAYTISRQGGDRTIDAFYVGNEGDAGTGLLQLESFTAATSRISGMLAQPVLMGPGWRLAFNVTGGTTDGAWRLRTLVTEIRSR